jgi:hypothetical protein
MRHLLLTAITAIGLTTVANADDDPDISRYPAPKLRPQTTGCATIHDKSTINDWPYVSHICVGDTARAQDIGCPSVADLYHTDKRLEDTLEDMKRRQRKFGCKDIDGLKLHVIEVYQGTGHACGIDNSRNRWCLTVEGFQGVTTVTMPDGKTFKK